MAKPRKKDQKKPVEEIEPQLTNLEEEEASFSYEKFFLKYRQYILGAAGAVVLIVSGIIFYQFYIGQQDSEAHREMFRAVQYFEADSFALALNGDGTYFGLYDIEDEYSGTEAANLAKYYIGIILLNQDSADVEGGIEYLESFNKPSNSILSTAAYSALGFAYEDLGEFEKAARQFELGLSVFGEDNEYLAPTLLLNAGRNYEQAGDFSNARNAYLRIKEEYPLSTEGVSIDKYLGRISE